MSSKFRILGSVVLFLIAVAAVVAALTSQHSVALAMLVVFALALLVLAFFDRRQRRRHSVTDLPVLDAAQASEYRALRETDGEVKAVAALRRDHPDLSLANAVAVVRQL